MTRRRYVYDERLKKLVEVPLERPIEDAGPLLVPDLPGYVSPVTGLWVEGRRARREDLKRSGCRPYEGREQEQKEIARQRAYEEQRADARLERSIAEIYSHMPERVRRELRGR